MSGPVAVFPFRAVDGYRACVNWSDGVLWLVEDSEEALFEDLRIALSEV